MMLRRQALTLGSLLLSTLTLGGWSLFRQKGKSPLLLSARDDSDGRHYAVGYRLDGTQVFATQVGQRCHDIINHPTQPLALFVARRPGTESYLVDLRDGRLLQTITGATRSAAATADSAQAWGCLPGSDGQPALEEAIG